MSEPVLKFVDCPDPMGGHRMAYWQWGQPECGHVVMCVHGLTRQGRDFDVLATALRQAASDAVCVVCPDVAGRGRSDWLKDPQAYQVPTYAGDMFTLLAALNARTLDWVGTSMGGLIGLLVAGQTNLPAYTKVRRLVLNDVGPVIEWTALQRIGRYLGNAAVFDSVEHAAATLLAFYHGFGPHTPEQWLKLSLPNLKPLGDGSDRVCLRYDPALAEPFKAVNADSALQGEALLWHLYDQIQAQTLVLRGAESDLLSSATAQAMTQRGPQARLIEFAGVGHAPTFVPDDQVQVVVDFLIDAHQAISA